MPPMTLLAHCQQTWDEAIVPALSDYIRVPALSPAFDARWAEAGHLGTAVEQLETWARGRRITGMSVEVVKLGERTPSIVIEIPPSGTRDSNVTDERDDTVLLYGHYDKQPEMTGWRDDLGPWLPVQEDDRLYGRGGGDDGYSMFAALAAVEALQAEGGHHRRLLVLIEGSEESGSPDLAAYVDALSDRLGQVGLVIALDSGCLTYDQLWTTTSLRGLVNGTLRVEVLREGVHSGVASGVVPSSFRIVRMLLDRLEDARTGQLLLSELHAPIPDVRRAEATATATAIADAADLPFAGATRPMSDDPLERYLNHTWRPALSYTGADGLAPTARAGNVLRPYTALQLSCRLPPTADPARAARAIHDTLTADAPYDAVITFTNIIAAPGWNAPPTAPWLAQALGDASLTHFGRPHRTLGEGGSIPFMAMLGERFPAAQFVVTGVMGPGSNAHGPNEFVHLRAAERVTACIASVLSAHAQAAARADPTD